MKAHLTFNDFIRIASWNIQSVKDKLNEKLVREMLHVYDVVFLSKIKTTAKISCTGLEVFQHPAKQGHRGGVALLVKPGLCKFVRNLDRFY